MTYPKEQKTDEMKKNDVRILIEKTRFIWFSVLPSNDITVVFIMVVMSFLIIN